MANSSEDRRLADAPAQAVVEALGHLSEALETTYRARGHLYAFHQLTGKADFLLDDVIEKLRAAGEDDAAEAVKARLRGRDVLPDRWTFQIVEEYDEGYFAAFTELERELRERLAGGRRHLYEAQLKRDRQPGR